MNKLAILFLCLVLLPLTFAQSEYFDIERYTETGEALCLLDSDIYYGRAPILSGFTNGTRPAFTVTNPNDYPIQIFFNYTLEGDFTIPKFFGKRIEAKDSIVVPNTCFDGIIQGNCSINASKIDYFVTRPRELERCTTEIPMQREIYDRPCTSDTDCAESKCNIAGFCGLKKVVPCPEGKINCADLACVTPKQKHGGDICLCELECKSGICVKGVCKGNDLDPCQEDLDCLSGICNGANQCGAVIVCPAGTDNCKNAGCFAAANKSYGQSVMCEWECASGRGPNGVCLMATRTLVGFYTLLLLLAAAIAAYVGHWKLKELQKRRSCEEKLLADIKRSRDAIEKTMGIHIQKLVGLEEELRTIAEQKQSLKEEYARETGTAKNELKKELEKIDAEYKKKKESYDNREKLLEEAEDKQQRRREQLNASSREYYLKKYEERYGDKIFVRDGENYIRFKDGKQEYLHHYIYKSTYDTIPSGYEVHHIDANSFNNEIWNLIIVPHKLHNSRSGDKSLKIRHGRIWDWLSGYQELKRVGLDQEIFDNHPCIDRYYEENYKTSSPQ